MDVGFIGLGNMGAAMAPNLLNAGHRLTVYNRTRAKAEVLAAQGAQVAERVADACRGDIRAVQRFILSLFSNMVQGSV
jgi:3-hydroxyisobutyrate dehydrogenase-like beta-hydroxyacid dehydrogenase